MNLVVGVLRRIHSQICIYFYCGDFNFYYFIILLFYYFIFYFFFFLFILDYEGRIHYINGNIIIYYIYIHCLY